MPRFKTVQDVLAFAERDCNAVIYMQEILTDFGGNPDKPDHILAALENESAVIDEMLSGDVMGDDEYRWRSWYQGRLNAFAWMLRGFGLKPAFVDWKQEHAV